jgi:peptidoglycan-N-acetylglucosamine deacetylase
MNRKIRIYVLYKRNTAKYLLGLFILACALIAVRNANLSGVPVFVQERQIPIYSVESQERKVAITFDCAWGAGDIPDILQTLNQEDVRVTFFLVGQWAEKFPEAVKKMAENGHDVANHSYSHFRMDLLDAAKARQEIAVCGQKLNELSGQKIDLFRAPYGAYNNTVVNAAKSLGYHTIQWDVDSLDWKPGISESDILNRVLQKVKSGSIILFHNDTTHTAKMLPSVITALRKQGYEFVPVSQLILRDSFIIDHEGRQRGKE